MIGIKIGKVKEILKTTKNTSELLVDIQGEVFKSINYNNLTGAANIGDILLINTTAVDLSLGTGGFHFVISNLNHPNRSITDGGHIMKLRYSPYQLKVFAAEEQGSKYHEIFNDFQSLYGLPVIIGTLHSMLLPILETVKGMNSDLRITYIMTDGAALPIDLSNTVRELKAKGSLDSTITIGNAFGGDLDCVNIYNGLIAAKEILKCDLAVVTMGPGIVGTGTKYGFSGIEQGTIIDAVNNLGGIPIAVPRISFTDKRKRHFGISHHSITVFSEISKSSSIIGIPLFTDKKKNNLIHLQIKEAGIDEKHKVTFINSNRVDRITEMLDQSKEKMITMGRSYDVEKEFFITAGTAGEIAVSLLSDRQSAT